MTELTRMVQGAFAAALRMRKNAGYRLDEAICVYDLAERVGIEVRFTDIPSMEGMLYCSSKPVIILSSLRPMGRRSFTCAHELGHFHYGHGTIVDELVAKSPKKGFDSKEFVADCFAGALLMPKIAVQRAFSLRDWSIKGSNPGQIYTVSNYFGVGYSTLVHHLSKGLRLMPRPDAEELLKVGPRKAQAQVLGWESENKVWVVDPHWSGRAIDVEVGDLILAQRETDYEGGCLEGVEVSGNSLLFRACQPGLARVCNDSGWSAFVRVSRRAFVGRSIFRHLEDRDEEGSDGN